MTQIKAFFLRRLTFLSVAMILAALLAQLASHSWMFELLSHMTWYYFIGGLSLAAVFILLRSKYRALLMALLAISHLPLVMDSILPDAPAPVIDSDRAQLRILQFNVHSQNNEVEQLVPWLTSQAVLPDIIIFIEASSLMQPVIKQLQRSHWPYAVADYQEDNYGIAVVSRLRGAVIKLEAVGDQYLPSITVRGSSDDGNADFSLLATHPPPPISRELAHARNEQYRAFSDWAGNEAGENIIIAGDLNTTPWSPYFRRLLNESRLKNAQQGFGHGGSFPSWLPAIMGVPIDHMLVSSSIHVLKRETGPGWKFGSDHRLIETVLQLSAARPDNQ